MRAAVARLMGTTILSQGVLSAANFFVASYLLRMIGPEPFGLYVLGTTALLLFANLQGAFFLAPANVIIPTLGPYDRPSFVGALMHLRNRATVVIGLIVSLLASAAWLAGFVPLPRVSLVGVGVFTGLATLLREFCRGLLLTRQQGGIVLRGDVLYAILLVGASLVCVWVPHPEIAALAGVGVAAMISGALLLFGLWRLESWRSIRSRSVFARIAPMGAWAAFGSMIHWTFSQGYTYLVAALLDVKAVAALAATRLLLMPLNLLSSGVNQSMASLISHWHAKEGLGVTLRRAVKVSLLLLLVDLVYVLIAWLVRDLFFGDFLKRSFDKQDELVLLWSALFILMMVRDQLNCVLVVRERVKPLGYITLVSAISAVTTIWWFVPNIGVEGALLGIIAGEVLNAAGMVVLLLCEMKKAAKS